MALPVLQNSGGSLALAGGGMLTQSGSSQRESAEQVSWRAGMAAAVQAMYNTLVDIRDIQKDILDVLRKNELQADMAAEAGKVKDTSLDTKQKTTMFQDLKDIQSQAGNMLSNVLFTATLAALAWGNDLEAYVTSALKGIRTSIVNGLTALTKPILGLFSFIGKFITGRFDVIKNLVAKVTKGFDAVKDFFSLTSELVKGFVSTSSFVAKIGESVQKGVAIISKIVAPIMPFLTNVGSFIKKILWPLQIFFSIFDFVKGFMNTQGNIVEKFIGGITEVFIGLFVKPLDLLLSFVGFEGSPISKQVREMVQGVVDFFKSPLDSLKNLFSSVSEKLGFEAFSEWLDSFSIIDMLKEMLQGAVDVIKAPWNYIKSFVGGSDEPEPVQTQRTYRGATGNIPGVSNMYDAERESAAVAPAAKSRAEIRAARRARIDAASKSLERGSRATGTGGSGAIAGRVAAAQSSAVSESVAGATTSVTGKEFTGTFSWLEATMYKEKLLAEMEEARDAEAALEQERLRLRRERRARLDGGILKRGSRATGTGGSMDYASKALATQSSSVSGAVAGAAAASTSVKYPPNTVRGIVHQVMPEATETEKQVRTVAIADALGFDTDKPLSKDDMFFAEGAAYKLAGKQKPTGFKSSMAVAAEQLSKEQNATTNQLQPNVTVPSAVTSGMSAQAKQAERARAQVNVAPSIVNAPTNVTNNTVASGGGGLSGTFSRSSSNPSERRAPTVTIGIRG